MAAGSWKGQGEEGDVAEVWELVVAKTSSLQLLNTLKQNISG